jgi:predicted dehydrogenase
MNSSDSSRRDFLKTAGMGTVLLSAASVSRVYGANDRINMGVIGCGGMGTGHLSSMVKRSEADNLRVLSVCDVYQRRLTRAKKISETDGFLDYRKVLDNKDVDALLIATPDHWHGKISIDAVESGKHVYCEKPLTHTVEQAIAVREAVRKTKKILQVGPNATASDSYWQAQKAIKDGRIGTVTWAQGSYNRNAREC